MTLTKAEVESRAKLIKELLEQRREPHALPNRGMAWSYRDNGDEIYEKNEIMQGGEDDSLEIDQETGQAIEQEIDKINADIYELLTSNTNEEDICAIICDICCRLKTSFIKPNTLLLDDLFKLYNDKTYIKLYEGELLGVMIIKKMILSLIEPYSTGQPINPLTDLWREDDSDWGGCCDSWWGVNPAEKIIQLLQKYSWFSNESIENPTCTAVENIVKAMNDLLQDANEKQKHIMQKLQELSRDLIKQGYASYPINPRVSFCLVTTLQLFKNLVKNGKDNDIKKILSSISLVKENLYGFIESLTRIEEEWINARLLYQAFGDLMLELGRKSRNQGMQCFKEARQCYSKIAALFPKNTYENRLEELNLKFKELIISQEENNKRESGFFSTEKSLQKQALIEEIYGFFDKFKTDLQREQKCDIYLISIKRNLIRDFSFYLAYHETKTWIYFPTLIKLEGSNELILLTNESIGKKGKRSFIGDFPHGPIPIDIDAGTAAAIPFPPPTENFYTLYIRRLCQELKCHKYDPVYGEIAKKGGRRQFANDIFYYNLKKYTDKWICLLEKEGKQKYTCERDLLFRAIQTFDGTDVNNLKYYDDEKSEGCCSGYFSVRLYDDLNAGFGDFYNGRMTYGDNFDNFYKKRMKEMKERGHIFKNICVVKAPVIGEKRKRTQGDDPKPKKRRKIGGGNCSDPGDQGKGQDQGDGNSTNFKP